MWETARVGGKGLKTLGERCVVSQLTQPSRPVFVNPKHANIYCSLRSQYGLCCSIAQDGGRVRLFFMSSHCCFIINKFSSFSLVY